MRAATLVIAAFGTLIWLLLLGLTLFSASDPATADLDSLAGIAATIVFALTAGPAFFLAARNRAPRTAFALAIAFPAVIGLLFAFAVANLPG